MPILLRRAWYGLNQAFRRRVAHLQLTPDQFTAMRTLLEGDENGMVQSELVSQMSSDPNTVAALLDRMEENGLVRRRKHETDRRANRIQTTAQGRKKYEAARKIAVELQASVLSVLPVGAREEFLGRLAEVADACQAAAELSPRKRN